MENSRNKYSLLQGLFELNGNDKIRRNEHKELFHYTNYTNLFSILNNEELYATCITEFSEKYGEKVQYANSQENSVFVICFQNNGKNKMFKKFKNSDLRIKLFFNNDMYALFDFSRPVVSNTGDKIMWCNRGNFNNINFEEFAENLFVDINFYDICYLHTGIFNSIKENKIVNLKIDDIDSKYIILNKNSYLPKNLSFQNGTRYEFKLRSTLNSREVSKYNYLKIPIKFSNIELLIEISEYFKNHNKSQYNELVKFLNKKHINYQTI